MIIYFIKPFKNVFKAAYYVKINYIIIINF